MTCSPVTEGEFLSGPELMLWRPGLNRRRLRWRATLPSLLRTIAAAAIVGVGIDVLASNGTSATFAWLVIIFLIVITGISAVGTVVDYLCAEDDHRHRQDRPCSLETPGKFFYRAGDFRSFPSATIDSIRRIIGTVGRVHSSPAVVWLSGRQLHAIHQVAWEALRILDGTRTLRDVLTDSRHTDCDELTLARGYLTDTDEAVDRVLTGLLQVELLVTSWEHKLVEIDWRTQLRNELSRMPLAAIATTIHRAESIPEGVFAYITAARDLTNAGPFPWERPCNQPESLEAPA